MKIADIVSGTPATICYPHDTTAAVVVKRTPKRVTVARVEVTSPVRVDGGGDNTPPITESEGILDKIIKGTEQVYTLRERDGRVRATREGAQPVVFGYSVSRRNYQNF